MQPSVNTCCVRVFVCLSCLQFNCTCCLQMTQIEPWSRVCWIHGTSHMKCQTWNQTHKSQTYKSFNKRKHTDLPRTHKYHCPSNINFFAKWGWCLIGCVSKSSYPWVKYLQLSRPAVKKVGGLAEGMERQIEWGRERWTDGWWMGGGPRPTPNSAHMILQTQTPNLSVWQHERSTPEKCQVTAVKQK